MVALIIKLLRGFAILWFTLAAGSILASTIAIWDREGFGRVQEVFSPFNVINFVAVLIILAPGLGARMLAGRLEERSSGDAPISEVKS